VLGLAGVLVLTGVLVPAANGSKPGDLLYTIDRSAESAQIAFSGLSGAQAQAETYLNLADERIAELEALIGKVNTASLIQVVYAEDNDSEADLSEDEQKDVDDLADDYSDNIEKANELAQEAKDNGVDTDELLIKVAESTLKHQEVLLAVYDRVPEQAKDAIMNAMEKSQNGHDKATAAISGQLREQIQQEQEERKQELDLKIEERKNKAQENRENGLDNKNTGGKPDSSN